MTTETIKRPVAKIFHSERWKNDHSKRFVSKPQQQKICEIKESCGSCRYINSAYESSLLDKYNRVLSKFREHNLLEGTTVIDPVASPRATGYRTHAKLAVRPSPPKPFGVSSTQRFAIGLFQPQSHQIVPLKDCPLHRDSINRLLPDLQSELEASDLQPYLEASHSGDIRYIAIRASHLTEEVMLTFVTLNEAVRIELKAIVLRLRQKGHLIVAAFQNINPSQTNAIFGSTTRKLAGSDGLRESLCGLTFEIGPTSFFQVNPWQAINIYRRVEQLAGQASSTAVAWDLYCGMGQISLVLAKQGFRTLGIEENPEAIAEAERSAKRNFIDQKQAVSFLAAKVEDTEGSLPAWASKPELIVVNPSRRGIAPAAREMIARGLKNNSKARLVYVSCEGETMIRDLVELLSHGHKVLQLECFDMFPFTEKLEWLAIVQ